MKEQTSAFRWASVGESVRRVVVVGDKESTSSSPVVVVFSAAKHDFGGIGGRIDYVVAPQCLVDNIEDDTRFLPKLLKCYLDEVPNRP